MLLNGYCKIDWAFEKGEGLGGALCMRDLTVFIKSLDQAHKMEVIE